MKLALLQTGKTDEAYIRDAVAVYEKRTAKYVRFEILTLPDIRNAKNMPASVLKEKEAEQMLAVFRPDDLVILLDDKGREYTTLQFSAFLSERMMSSKKRILLVMGGAWGSMKRYTPVQIIKCRSQSLLFLISWYDCCSQSNCTGH